MSSPNNIARMLNQALTWMREAEQLQRHFFSFKTDKNNGPCWEPPVDVIENDQGLIILVALPGVPAENVKVIFAESGLHILASRATCENLPGFVRQLEIPFGHFERHINLSPQSYQLVNQKLVNGCLTLKLDKIN